MPSDPNKRQCSLLFFLATPDEEDALREAAAARSIAFEKVKDKILGEYHWLGQVGNELVIANRPSRRAGRLVMGAHGRLGTASRGIRFQEATGAQAILQIGMAFGIDPGRQRPADVLVATELIPYDDRGIKPRPDGLAGCISDFSKTEREPARPSLIDLFRQEARRTARDYGVHFGAMLSGSARIHCATFRDELVRNIPAGEEPIIGGEMEGIGLIAASRSDDDPIWCIVKGISDFADEGRDAVIDRNRPVACRNAADFALSAIQNVIMGSDLSSEEKTG